MEGTTLTMNTAAPSSAGQWAVGTVAFAVEIALVAIGGIVGYRLAYQLGTAGRWSAAAVAVVVLVAIWARWMAPAADDRLPATGRVLLAAVLIGLVAVGMWATGSPAVALVFGIVGIAAMAIGQPLLDSQQH